MSPDQEPQARKSPKKQRLDDSAAAEVGIQDTPSVLDRVNVIVVSFLTFALIGFGVWLVLGGKRYREEYAQATPDWRVGTSRQVEITLVKSDKENLACASEQTIAGLRCGYGRDQRSTSGLSADDPQLLQPYNTVGGELLLGAGLWTSTDLKQGLPSSRFSVLCNYNIKGVIKSGRIRFAPSAGFESLSKTVTVGTFSDCVLPK